jgi:threonine dehydrogenase-like Zn-dependent dehydrogenase
MKALAIFPGSREIRIIQVPEPTLERDQVAVRPLEVGICGTDRDLARFLFGTPPPGLDYLVLGHEMLGEVTEVGPEAAGLRKGDLVVPTVRRPCPDPECLPCRAHQSDMCATDRFTERGIRAASGYMTEVVVEKPEFLTVVPPELRAVGVLLEPLTVTEKALAEVEQIQGRLPWDCPPGRPGGRYGCRSALVLGAGPIGFLAALALADLGMRTALVSRNPPHDPKIRVLEAAGIRYFSTAASTSEEVAAAAGAPDVILEAAGSSALFFDYLRILAVNGICLLTGIAGPGNRLAVDGDLVMRRLVQMNQVVVGVVNANAAAFGRGIARLGRLARRFPEVLPALVTARVPLESFARHLVEKQPGEIKTVLTP